MNNKSHIENEVQATINSIDGICSATPGPFFFTRVQARLNKAEKNVWEKITSFVARPAVAIAMVSCVIVLNTVAILQHKQVTTLSADQTDQSNYDEFTVAVNTFYDYEIKEP